MKYFKHAKINREAILKAGCLIIVFVVTFLSFRWSLSENHYFFADDWAWLYRAEFQTFSELFSIFPKAIYNNRPVGAIIIKAIYEIVGLNNVAFHFFWLLIHMVNTLLVLLISRKIFNSFYWGIITAILFGNYVIASTCVTWVAAIFDLFGNTLLLLSLYFYLKDRRHFGLLLIISLLSYYLAVRTKEMAILLPLFLTIYELSQIGWRLNKEELLKIIRKQFPYYLIFITMGIFYTFLYAQSLPVSTETNSPYFQSFTFIDFLQGLRFYLNTLLYLQSETFIPLIIFAVIVLFSFLLNKKEIIFSSLVFVVSLLPVVFLKNHRMELYLYIPVVYFCLMLTGLLNLQIDFIFDKIIKRGNKNLGLFLIFVIIVSFSLALQNTNFVNNRVNWTINHARVYKENIDYIKAEFPKLKPNTKFFISGLPKYLNVFDYGKGYSLKVLYKDSYIKCEIYKPDEELRKEFLEYRGPKYFLRYEDGKLHRAYI